MGEEPREMTACSYGAVEAGAGAARQHGSAYRNYMAAVIGAWAGLFAATVLIVGYASQSSIALEQQAHTQMLEFTFEPERNVFEEFDPEGSAPEPWKQEYDLAKEANYEMINIKDAAPDAAEAGAITEGVEDPYDVNVVELGEPSLGQPFQEYDHSQEYSEDLGKAAMGEEYVPVEWGKTIETVPEANPSREWASLSNPQDAGVTFD